MAVSIPWSATRRANLQDHELPGVEARVHARPSWRGSASGHVDAVGNHVDTLDVGAVQGDQVLALLPVERDQAIGFRGEIRLDSAPLRRKPIESLAPARRAKVVQGDHERQVAALLQPQGRDAGQKGAGMDHVVAAATRARAHHAGREVVHAWQERLGRNETRWPGGDADYAHIGTHLDDRGSP